MNAVLLDRPGAPLSLRELPDPVPAPGELLLRVAACGVCRTDLHVIDGDLPDAAWPVILGHEIVGVVEEPGEGVTGFAPGDRVGVPWLGGVCGACPRCAEGRENLCPDAVFTGYHRQGGFAQKTTADARFCFRLPDALDDAHAAPLLCAGLIGWRALSMTEGARRLGLYGFGASAHILAQVAVAEGREVAAFTRPGDGTKQDFARELSCVWAGGSDEAAPFPLDAAILLAPAGELVPIALRAVRPGGVVVCGGIHMTDIPSFPYADLWGERVLRSVANLTRRDGEEFLAAAARHGVRTEVETFPLSRAQEAVDRLRAGTVRGAAVLIP